MLQLFWKDGKMKSNCMVNFRIKTRKEWSFKMEYEKIKKLMDDMGNSKLTSIDIDFPDGTKISMKKDTNGANATTTTTTAATTAATTTAAVAETIAQKVARISNNMVQEAAVEESADANNAGAKEQAKSGNIIKSPMVGTFYLKPSPTSEPFVTVGKSINKGNTVCIIEAMKLMNEIESEYSGVVKEVLVKDGEPVEYGTALFVVE